MKKRIAGLIYILVLCFISFVHFKRIAPLVFRGKTCPYDLFNYIMPDNSFWMFGIIMITFFVFYPKTRTAIMVSYNSRNVFIIRNSLICLREAIFFSVMVYVYAVGLSYAYADVKTCNWLSPDSHMRALYPGRLQNPHVYDEVTFFGIEYLAFFIKMLMVLVLNIALISLFGLVYQIVGTYALYIQNAYALSRHFGTKFAIFITYRIDTAGLFLHGLDLSGWPMGIYIIGFIAAVTLMVFKRKNIIVR